MTTFSGNNIATANMHELATFYQLQQQAQELLQQSQNKILAAQLQLNRSQSVHNQQPIAPTAPNTMAKQPAQRSLSDISTYYNTSSQRESMPTRSPPGLTPPLQKSLTHSQLILAQLPQPPCVSLQRRESVKSDSGIQTLESPSRYKTEMCRPFEETGRCRYGSKCQFAHGINELRSLNRHPRYKTEFCRTFHTTGFCSYGQRCNFIHNEDERRVPPPATNTRPAGLPLNSSFPVSNSSGSSPANSVYGGDVSPTHSPNYPEDPFSLRLSPAPSLSSFTSDVSSNSVSFPSPPATPLDTDDFTSDSKMFSSQDLGLSYYLNNLNLRQ